MMKGTVLLSQSDIQEVLTMKDVVEICDKTFQGLGTGKTICPTKVGLDLGEQASYPPYEGYMNAMPAYIGWCDSAGIKWAGGILGERKKEGLPYITAMILLMNPKIGNFTAAMDGALITNWRTGAQAAVSLKYLFKGNKSIKIGIYGAGMQGRTSTMAISEVFDIEELKVYDLYKESAEKFKEDPKRMQVETMALFKKAGANPLGGCLPMILQMPIFFAFYQVLYNAVELVGSPFIFWITDLSTKDIFYVKSRTHNYFNEWPLLIKH